MKTLEYGDKITFKYKGNEYKYEVHDSHLNGKGCSNEAIFDALKLDKYEFCSIQYGYRVDGGDWPEYHYEDYESVTRVVQAIKQLTGELGINNYKIY